MEYRDIYCRNYLEPHKLALKRFVSVGHENGVKDMRRERTSDRLWLIFIDMGFFCLVISLLDSNVVSISTCLLCTIFGQFYLWKTISSRKNKFFFVQIFLFTYFLFLLLRYSVRCLKIV